MSCCPATISTARFRTSTRSAAPAIAIRVRGPIRSTSCARCTPTCWCRATRGRFPVPDIETALTDYRDAIRYVYDQPIRQINQGRTPDEIAATLKLPAHLAASPYLQALYGNVDRKSTRLNS